MLVQIGRFEFTRCPVIDVAPEEELMVTRWHRGVANSASALERELWPAAETAALSFLDNLRAEELAALGDTADG